MSFKTLRRLLMSFKSLPTKFLPTNYLPKKYRNTNNFKTYNNSNKSKSNSVISESKINLDELYEEKQKKTTRNRNKLKILTTNEKVIYELTKDGPLTFHKSITPTSTPISEIYTTIPLNSLHHFETFSTQVEQLVNDDLKVSNFVYIKYRILYENCMSRHFLKIKNYVNFFIKCSH